jgi:hypothetical protein
MTEECQEYYLICVCCDNGCDDPCNTPHGWLDVVADPEECVCWTHIGLCPECAAQGGSSYG